MKKKLKIFLSFSLGLMMCSQISFSQDTSSAGKKEKDNRPVRAPFESNMLMSDQTVTIPNAHSLEFMIQHRFGKLNSNTFDLIGLYAPSNIRLGLSYTLTDYLQLGIGTTKTDKIQDINWKWRILQQTRSGSIPVALTYYGNVELSARSKQSFGQDYAFLQRVSYYHQLIIARKFGRRLSLQVLAEYDHFNQIDTIAYKGLKHDNFGLSLDGRFKVRPQLNIIFSGDKQLTTPEEIKPNLSIGIEIVTTSHAFQIFVGSYNKISPQDNLTYNTNDFTNKDILLGFNISHLWNF